jgi:hypothetical protein
VRRIFRSRIPLPTPIVVCDEPEEGSEVTRGTVVSGWAYSPAGIKEVSVWLDGQKVVGEAELGLERPDVAQAHPDWADAGRSGFRYRIEAAPQAGASAEAVELRIVAEDGEGRRVEARRAVQVDELLFDPIVVCDEPEEGSEVSLGTVVSGWAYSPAGIKEVSVWLEGQRVGEAEYGLVREDVAQNRPEWLGAERSGFRYRFETLPAAAEAVELTVVAEDERGRRAEVGRVIRRDRRELLKEKLDSEMQEFRRLNDEIRATKVRAQRLEHVKRSIKKKLELRELETELRAAQGRAEGEPAMGALPDFVIIGVAKGGTTFLYHLLTQHPLVEPAAFKEPHYFDLLIEDEGVEWYRRCFPQPKLKDGRRTITGEASPVYLWDTVVPQRMAGVIPHVRLIALLRNPVDRTYSGYHWRKNVGWETRTFEEAIEASFDSPDELHRSGSIYVDHLQRWSEYFPREQMLVLKSEDLFDDPRQTLETVLEFLGLPEWEPDASALGNMRNTGSYKQKMDPATRRRLEEYFEPHNRRLYDFLGKDFGW